MKPVEHLSAALLLGLGLAACGGGQKDQAKKAAPAATANKAGKGGKAVASEPPTPARDKLPPGEADTLILSQAWFWKDASGKPKPGPARLQIWRKSAEGWKAYRVEDADSNVFHKTIMLDGASFLTIGGEKAMLKKWTWTGSDWKDELLWTRDWGGKFNRLRDIEVGDVDGDGKDEYVIATHDNGVVAVYNPPEDGGQAQVIELGAKPDTFVHEIEICDVDGDGKLEFFATPSDRNKANASQEGHVTMYRWDGSTYQPTVVDPMGNTHAKEILCADIDGDGKGDLFSVLEAETDDRKQVVKPVEIRRYFLQPDGSFTHEAVATIQDRQTRFLIAGDFDDDGTQELIAAAMKTGLYFIDQQKGDDGKVTWPISRIDQVSSGFEHATTAADLDGDGKLEVYVAADDQRELKRYTWNPERKAFDKQLLGRLNDATITWGITATRF